MNPPLIATGWDSPNPARFRRELAAFEAWGVFDGTVLHPTRRGPDGRQIDAKNAFSRERWRWDEFAEPLADLRAARPTTCRENYLALYANPGDVDWFDDSGWEAIVDHARLLARLARRGGLRGLLFDAEPYVAPHAIFRYDAQPGRASRSYAAYRVKARERGRAWMRAVVAEFPDIRIFTYRLFSDMVDAQTSGGADALLGAPYGLLPAFVDGWLDVAPTVRVVEGAEELGYHASRAETYLAGFARLHLALPGFVAPEHREAVRRRFSVGHSVYLDAYVNPPGHPYHIDRGGASAAVRLAANVAGALAATDALVWVYGETGRWWPGGDPKHPLWPEKLPGADRALQIARDPAAAALARRSSAKNRIENPELRTSAAWWTWQEDGQTGRWTFGDGAVALHAMRGGVAGQSVPVPAAGLYAVAVDVRPDPGCVPVLGVGWKTAAGNWTATSANRNFRRLLPGAGGWQRLAGIVEAPEGAGQLIFMVGSSLNAAASGVCRFARPFVGDAL